MGVSFLHLSDTENTENPKDEVNPKINPAKIIENTKNKIDNYYTNFKKEREKEKIKLEKKRKLDAKKENLKISMKYL